MKNWIDERQNKLREFFELDSQTELIPHQIVEQFSLSSNAAEHLEKHNIEWHVVPSAAAVPIDTDDYRARLYPKLKFDAASRDYQKTSSYRAIMGGHERHQGRIIGVETTIKPKYLPGNRQFYGTPYGFEPRADPLAAYFGQARMMSGTRYAHNYRSLRNLVNFITQDWTKRGLMPPGYRLTICPPVIFNLVGTIFHGMESNRVLGTRLLPRRKQQRQMLRRRLRTRRAIFPTFTKSKPNRIGHYSVFGPRSFPKRKISDAETQRREGAKTLKSAFVFLCVSVSLRLFR